jgi:hypothetical protein
LTLIATTSLGSMKRRHAASVSFSPVSARMPRSIISRTSSGSTGASAVVGRRDERVRTTLPGYGPGMPGTVAGA